MSEETPLEVCDLRQQLLDCKGHALVIGGPGSGKTTIALKKAVVRISDGLGPGQSVLFLSFSRAAVARVGEATRLEVPKAQRGMLSMQTFHSFFWTLLSAHAYLLGAPKSLRILLPQDEQAKYGTIKAKDRKEENPEWQAWLQERERLFREDGLIAFDLFPSNAAQLLERSALRPPPHHATPPTDHRGRGPGHQRTCLALHRVARTCCTGDLPGGP